MHQAPHAPHSDAYCSAGVPWMDDEKEPAARSKLRGVKCVWNTGVCFVENVCISSGEVISFRFRFPSACSRVRQHVQRRSDTAPPPRPLPGARKTGCALG